MMFYTAILKISFYFCFFIFYSQTEAQTSENKNGLTYKFVITDYNTLDPVFQNANDPDRIIHPEDINYAGEIGFFRNINKSFSLGIPFRLGSIDAHHSVFDSNDTLCQPCEQRKRNELFVSADIVAVYKFNNDYLLKENFMIAPYIFFGAGGLYLSQREGNFDFQLPMGLGLNVKLTELMYLQAQIEYRKSLIIQKDNFGISGGIFWLLNFKKEAE